MGKTRWQGVHLYNLLNLSIAELVERYPEHTRGTLKGKKAYWKQKLKEGKIVMPEQPRLVKTWEVSAFDRVNNEWTTTENHLYDNNAIDEQFVAATPARITPSKRKPAQRDYRVLVAFGDAQVDYRRTEEGLEPIHDERALRIARMVCGELQPDIIINLGDTVDLAALSKFKKDSDHFQRTLGPSFQRVHDFYAELRADNPQARIIEVDSNHNTRLKDFALRQAPELYGIRQAGTESWPVLSYPHLANLDHLNVEWISGYGAAEFVYGEQYDTPPIVFKHGNTMASNASTASKESKENPYTHVVRGHGHRIERHTRTTRAGHYLSSIMVGALCRTDGVVPSYHSAVNDRGRPVKQQENWQNSILVIYDYNGHYQFDDISIRDGIAIYNGKLYNGNE